MTCHADGCTRPVVYGKIGLCKQHYDRRRYQGDENARPVYTRGMSEQAKLDHYRVVTDGGCFGWSGHLSDRGYGMIYSGGRAGSLKAAHRVAYRLSTGHDPGQLQVDHQCHNEDLTCPGGPTCLHRRCTNPDHLRAVTRQENMANARRGQRPNRGNNHNALKTHDKWGHEFTPDNTYWSQGRRFCRTCYALRARGEHPSQIARRS